MAEIYLLVREERHTDNEYWAFRDKDNAIQEANKLTDLWFAASEISADEVDMDCPEGLLFSAQSEDGFWIYVQEIWLFEANEPINVVDIAI